jgi:hypothetical protein
LNKATGAYDQIKAELESLQAEADALWPKLHTKDRQKFQEGKVEKHISIFRAAVLRLSGNGYEYAKVRDRLDEVKIAVEEARAAMEKSQTALLELLDQAEGHLEAAQEDEHLPLIRELSLKGAEAAGAKIRAGLNGLEVRLDPPLQKRLESIFNKIKGRNQNDY